MKLQNNHPTIQDYFKSLWHTATNHAFAKSVARQSKQALEQAKEGIIKTGNGLKAASDAFMKEFKEPCKSSK